MRSLACNHDDFWEFVTHHVLGGGLPKYIERFVDNDSLYVLSGVSRDYVLERYDEEVRDVDFVIDTKSFRSRKLVEEYNGKKNSFGGAKLQVNGVAVDVWPLRKTWGIIDGKMSPDVDSLLKSVFFNCTAIVYDVAKRSFLADDGFFDFAEKGILDIVYDKNPNEPLCVVNAFSYQDKYKTSLSPRLNDWLIAADGRIEDYEATERKHFQRVLFSNQEIKRRIIQLKG